MNIHSVFLIDPQKSLFPSGITWTPIRTFTVSFDVVSLEDQTVAFSKKLMDSVHRNRLTPSCHKNPVIGN